MYKRQVLGICNGFQTLIKLGLLTGGKIEPQKADSPTLTTNNIGRHISRMAYLKVVSNLSPWLRKAELGGVYCNPMSHGEDVYKRQGLYSLRAVPVSTGAASSVGGDGCDEPLYAAQ